MAEHEARGLATEPVHPRVEFTLGTGKYVEYIDVDLDLLADTLRCSGLSDEQIKSLRVLFILGPSDVSGALGFNEKTGQNTIYLNPAAPLEEINITLYHEISHYLDYMKDPDKFDIAAEVNPVWRNLTYTRLGRFAYKNLPRERRAEKFSRKISAGHGDTIFFERKD